ncbi:unnamed protein product [Spirodela intermedia]|uniref:Uncharacterized protein n=1 Tax=Spirodela intermedia TaxID=51605 RepID=A0A7I8IK17_SPIIN|nr:unnamed protein product [Spirodela intermedia]CAA6658221.1 unnamed protein product [Spirodela intermedia]
MRRWFHGIEFIAETLNTHKRKKKKKRRKKRR